MSRLRHLVAVLSVMAACATGPRGAGAPRTVEATADLASLNRAAVAADPVVNKPPFTATPAELLAVARGQSSDKGAVVLLEERRHAYDEAGLATVRFRSVYVITGQAGMEHWNDVGSAWAPWHEARPELRARVINPDGRVFELDPRTIEEGAGRAHGDDIYSDVRRLRAPLPGLSVGSVVEYEVVEKENAPLFEGGTSSQFAFYGSVPTLRLRLVVEHPDALPVTFSTRGPQGPEPKTTQAEGRQRVVYEAGPLLPIEDFDDGLPPDQFPVPIVGYTTGTSWARLASAYHRQAQQRLEGAEVARLIKSAKGLAGREARIRAAIAQLHEEVRYTGLEFGESSLIPNTPAEVVQRRFGDCKDKSLLLVAMLKAMGIEAHMALLNAGFGLDVDPKLPGIGRFNHAIVYVPGAPAYWVDATAEYTPLGDLPESVQGRKALVIASDTQALSDIPHARPEQNLTVEDRVYRLEEDEPARLVETTRALGAEGGSLRGSYRGVDETKTRENLENYIKAQYGAKKLTRYRHSDVKTVDEPFELQLEIEAPEQASVAESDAAVTMNVLNLLSGLPPSLRSFPEHDADDKLTPAEIKAKRREEARTSDYQLPRAYVYELNHTTYPPQGFVPDRVPADQSWPVGEGKITQRSEKRPDGSVKLQMVLHTGPRRMTAEQLRAFRKGLKAFLDSDAVQVTFLQEGEAHLEAGRVRQALESFRKLMQAHPEVPRHHARFARALLAAGLGGAARKTIDEAIARFPKAAVLRLAKGWIYEHDLMGQRFRRGFDHATALAAYREGEKLDDTNDVIKGSIGILLEHDVEGGRTYPVAHMPAARAVYQTLHERKVTGFDVNYLLVLLKLGAWKNLLALEKKMALSEVGLAGRLMALVQTEGLEAALAEAARSTLSAAGTAEAMRMAGVELMQRREYAKAAKMLAEAARNHENADALRQLASQLTQLRHHETLGTRADKPADLARLFGLASLEVARTGSTEAFKPLFAGPAATQLRDEIKDEGGFVEGLRAAIRDADTDAPLPVLKDMLALVPAKVEGDDDVGHRVELQAASSQIRLYTQRIGKRYAVTAVPWATHTLGEVAGEFLRRKDLKAARRWLDWAAMEAGGRAEDPLLTPPLLHVWAPGFPASEDTIRTAVAVLTVPVNGKDPSVLEGCIAKPPSEAARLGCEMALWAYFAKEKQPEKAAALSASWSTRFPDSQVALGGHVRSLMHMNDLQGAETWLVKHAGGLANDPAILRLRAALADRKNDLKGAVALLRKVTAADRSIPLDFNNLAWCLWAGGGDRKEAEKLAAEASRRDNRQSEASLHTWAAIVADAGRPEEALTLLHEAGRKRKASAGDADWLVIGLIAEAYGLQDVAAEAYGLVKQEEGDQGVSSAYAISQKRLQALRAAARPKVSNR